MEDIGEVIEQIEETPVWERREGENNLWYSRFEAYRLMGPNRSIRSCYRAEYEANGDTPGENPPSAWYTAANTHNWAERAEEWDKQQRLIKRKQYSEATEAAQKRNQEALNMGLEKAISAIEQAKEGSGDQRLWVNTLAVLTAERRKEYGYDITKTQEVDPLEVIDVQPPESDYED